MHDLIPTVVETEPFSPQRSRRKEAARLYIALRGLAVSKDILLYSREEFERWKNSLSHVIDRAAEIRNVSTLLTCVEKLMVPKSLG